MPDSRVKVLVNVPTRGSPFSINAKIGSVERAETAEAEVARLKALLCELGSA
jgi:hypothetical protein